MEELKDYEERDNPYAWVHPAEPPSRCGLKYSPQSFRRLATVYAILSVMLLVCLLAIRFTNVVTYEPEGAYRINNQPVSMPLWFIVIIAVTAVGTFILELVMIYRGYAILQGTTFARTKPGMSVIGFFIPLFNIYWMFAAPIGLSQGMNGYCRWKEIENGNMPCQVPTWLVILACASYFVAPITEAILRNHFIFGPQMDISSVILMIPVMFYFGNVAARIQETRLRER